MNADEKADGLLSPKVLRSGPSRIAQKPPLVHVARVSPAYLPLFVVIGVALDWAFFERMRTTIGMFRPWADNVGYRDELWPRIVLTITASVVVGIGSLSKVPNALLIIVGAGLFLASNFYVDYKMWRYGRDK